MGEAVLKLVQDPEPYLAEEEIVLAENYRKGHSLHYAISLSRRIFPEIASFFINRYTLAGETVLDPFAGVGTIGLEACLLGRIAVLAESDPLSSRIARAKLAPVDLAQVIMELQGAGLKGLASTSPFEKEFQAFYDINTFGEILHLKRFCNSAPEDPARSFIYLLALAILHGKGGGSLSASTYPQIALLPEEQEELNYKRQQVAEYRPVLPRIIKKAASVLRDGVSSAFLEMSSASKLITAPAANLVGVGTASVDLILTRPPVVNEDHDPQKQWLRYWFMGIDPYEPSSAPLSSKHFLTSLENWSDYLNSCLFEFARVSKPGSRLVFEFDRESLDSSPSSSADLIIEMVKSSFSRYWRYEGLLINKAIADQLAASRAGGLNNATSKEFLVLRRR